jgi:glycosyltransferase involved in cell wall biosynthesis
MLKHCFATIEKSAVGNHAIAINNALANSGFDVPMYSETIRPEFKSIVKNFELFKNDLVSNDVIFYQFANPSPMADVLYERKCKLVLNYHSITPAHFFDRFDLHTCEAISRARTQLARLAPICSGAVAVSDYNAQELVELGFRNVEVIPPVFSDVFYKAPSGDNQNVDGTTNWLFVGRIAPHKSIHKIIEAFEFYVRNINANAKLTLVGKSDVPLYGNKIKDLIRDRGLSDLVKIVENCPLEDLAGIYAKSSVFVSLSEHEGFGVPLVEAMASGLPILALREAAVQDTVSGAGILIVDASPINVAMAVNEIVENAPLRENLINKGLVRAQTFHPEETLKSYVDYLAKWY